MNEVAWFNHAHAADMATEVAARLAAIIRDAVAARGDAVLVFPGGRSPARVFQRLCASRLDWQRTTILPTDDRLVPKGHAMSNARLLESHFGVLGANLVPLVVDANVDVHVAGDRADARLRTLRWPPDIAWLGVGADGHTASIFPGLDLHQALTTDPQRRAVGVRPDPMPAEAPFPRLTLTRSAIHAARRLMITLTGDAKRTVVEAALADASGESSPIAAVLARRRCPVEIHWSPE